MVELIKYGGPKLISCINSSEYRRDFWDYYHGCESGSITTYHAMRLILQKAYKSGTDIHLLLTDFKQAYDLQTYKGIWDP